ncbi:alcohol dehydrogenase [Oceanicola sp. 22II-s10i]|uniref:aldo/keto reductase n=1 Tax=Oceanicola sp. 22II-s10i TaxID=1317116 RepID=UPI000B522BBE|nr:aldo/keto reductase [Oceanicola sp. 22II-s10i]OWU83590.1 alcohol dehydrogenase [Oceanicola sp. 22II-s10i]
MEPVRLGRTGLMISPVVFGCNVFDWTVDTAASHRLLDRMVEAGINTLDTADVYNRWVEGHSGGESETVLGKWFAADPSKRDKVVLITKIGGPMPEGRGLSAKWIEEEVEHSLKRLQTDRIDLYFSHRPDDSTPHEETLAAYERLIQSGKVRTIGASNFDAPRMEAAEAAAKAGGVTPYGAQQPEYNLYTRDVFEGPLAEFCIAHDVGVIPFFGLAAGFLSGKYRTEADLKGPRGERTISRFLNDRGLKILAAMDEVAEETGAKHAEIALAWLRKKPGVTAPIASATSDSQLDSLVASASLELSDSAMAKLDAAG